MLKAWKCVYAGPKEKITFPFSANSETGNGGTICEDSWIVGDVDISDTSGQVV